VIVACPKCRKQYRLDVTRLIYSKLPDNSGLGVRLACSNCHEQWWEIKKEQTNANNKELKAAIPEQPFRNLTDLSLLYGQKQGDIRGSYQQPLPKNFRFTATPERFAVNPKAVPEVEIPESTAPTKWQQIIKVALLSLLLFSSVVALAVFAMGYNLSSISNSNLDSKVPVPGEIVIEDVQFSTTVSDTSQQRVIVAGKIKNPTPLPIPLKNLEIIAFGTCTNNETPNEQGLCQLRSWQYKWKQDLIHPNEQLTFKSAAKVPSDTLVSQVYVDIPNIK
jgi:hypothetical protein